MAIFGSGRLRQEPHGFGDDPADGGRVGGDLVADQHVAASRRSGRGKTRARPARAGADEECDRNDVVMVVSCDGCERTRPSARALGAHDFTRLSDAGRAASHELRHPVSIARPTAEPPTGRGSVGGGRRRGNRG